MKTYELDPSLNWKMLKIGDYIKILDSGRIRSAKETGFSKDTFEIQAQIQNGLQKPWRMCKETRDNCEDAWGSDMDNWVGMWVRVTELRPVSFAGKTSKSIIAEPSEGPLSPQKLG